MWRLLFLGLFLFSYTEVSAQSVEEVEQEAYDYPQWWITTRPLAVIADPSITVGVEYILMPKWRTELELGWIYADNGIRVDNTWKLGGMRKVNIYGGISYRSKRVDEFQWVTHSSNAFQIAEYSQQVSGHAGALLGLGKHYHIDNMIALDMSFQVGYGYLFDKDYLLSDDRERLLRESKGRYAFIADFAFKMKFGVGKK
jgi:hypothetical protein